MLALFEDGGSLTTLRSRIGAVGTRVLGELNSRPKALLHGPNPKPNPMSLTLPKPKPNPYPHPHPTPSPNQGVAARKLRPPSRLAGRAARCAERRARRKGSCALGHPNPSPSPSPSPNPNPDQVAARWASCLARGELPQAGAPLGGCAPPSHPAVRPPGVGEVISIAEIALVRDVRWMFSEAKLYRTFRLR